MGALPAVIALIGAAALLLTWLLQSAPLFTRRASADSAAGGLRISEIMSANASTRTGNDAGIEDWIEIENASNHAIDLTGYALVRQTKPAQAFAFPGGVLQPGEFAVVHADDSGKAQQADGYHAPYRLPASGETLALLDKSGNGVDLVEIPALARNQVYCRDASGEWQISDAPTPGAANRVERYGGGDEDARPVAVQPGALEITEVMADNCTFFMDETGACPDYVEIHNTTSSPVDLAGWSLSDKAEKLQRWQFPSVTLPAGGYLAVHCSGMDRKADPAHLHTNFRISNKSDNVFLTDPNGNTVSHVRTPVMEPDQCYSLLETGWSKQFSPSPNYPNTPEGVDAAAREIQQRNDKGVRITEVLASSTKSDDWIELYNGTSAAVDLSGWGLSDNAGRPRKWQFPSGTTIQPGGYLGVFANGLNATAEGRIQTNYRLATDGGYSVVLSEPGGEIIDRLFVPMQYADISYGRTDDGSGLRFFTTVTPGAGNSGPAYYGRAPRPVYSVEGGMFKSGDSLTVELSVPSNCRIYYTLDCTDPTESSTPYTGPIQITDTTILRTRVYGEGYLESIMDSQSYLYNVNNGNGTVFVVSLVSDPYNLTSDEAGIMVKGPNAEPKYPYGSMNKGANFWMDWEREAHVEVFNPDGSTLISQECGIKLHGQFSRAEKQKAFKVIARSQYGANRFEAAIFSHRPYTEYQSFLLRSSSEDGYKTRFRDALLQRLAEGGCVDYQETEFGVLYIDGQYWGHYNLRERICKSNICQFEGWEGDEDDIDLVKANTNVMQGSNETMVQLLDYVTSHDMNTAEAYEVLDNAIDIQNYIEYMAVEMYTGNTDTLNVKRYRNPKKDGKWKWVLFDLDWSFSVDTNSPQRWLTPGGMGNNLRTDNKLFIACMKNETFVDRFLTYLGEKMATTYSADSIKAMVDEFYNAIAPLMPDHYARWEFSESEHKSAIREFVRYAEKRPYRMLQFIKYNKYLPLTQAQMEHYFGEVMQQVGVSYGDIGKP